LLICMSILCSPELGYIRKPYLGHTALSYAEPTSSLS
jgi:hypothetical protein